MKSPCLSLLFLFVCLAHAAAAAGVRRKVIIDQDAFGPGGPNQQPILLVLQSPDVEVLGITVESGDGWQRENVAHTLRMLERVGRTDVPVIGGATLPLLNTPEATKRWEARHGRLVYKGAWTEEWPAGTVNRRPIHAADVVPPSSEGEPTTVPRPGSAAEFLVQKVREFPGEVAILALGPLTNLALAAKLDEKFAANAREIVVMGGSFRPHAADNEFAQEYAHTPRLEFNFRWDPEAAAIVLRQPWRRAALVPVDPTTRTLFKPDLIARIKAADTPVARYVGRHLEGFPMWDELAAAVWLEPVIVAHQETLLLGIDTNADGAGYGNTLSWPLGQGPGLGERPWGVVLAADVPALERLVEARLTAGAPR